MNNNKTFTIDIIVSEVHLDNLQHVNNVVYVQFLQDAAFKHWNTHAPPHLQEQVLWVVRKHEIDYLASAYLNDELQVTTWTGNYTNVSWNRHYEIIRKSDLKKIISAKSVWILLDKKTFKPRKITEEVLQVLS